MRVTKRSGKVEDVRFDKVVTRISNLTHGLSPAVDSSKIAQQVFSSMYDGIHTNEIDTLSAEICVGMITSDPDYETLATRIVASNIQKTAPNNFHLAMKKLRTAGVVTDDVVKVAVLVKDKISPERDFDFGYFGLKTLEKSYLQKVDGKIIETPQYMFMRVAIGIHGDSLDDVLDTYDSMSRGLFTHATPTLFNAGTPRPQMSSCFLVANKSDSIDGVYGTITECAQISKWAGGIGVHIHDVRANKSYIRGTNGASDGIIPMLRVYNATARYVNQAGKRKGSIAVYLEPWHPDIMDFLELRLNQGDEEARCRDLFTALWIPDLFMKRVEEDGQWSLFCPDTAKGLSNCTGEEFEALYRKYEDEGLARETVPAQRVWKAILKSQVETGTPYMLYKDAINEKSNQKNLGVIKSSNLCVAPETNILTSEGYQTISHLKDQQVDVWNGFEWSPVVVRQTGVDQKLLTVTTSLGLSVRCTPYHKFPILSESDTKRPFECKDFVFVEAKDLKPGMCLIKHDLPLIEISDEKMKYAYTHGFFCADGTTSRPGEVHRCEFRAKKNGFCMRHQARVAEYEDDGRCQANSCVENKYIDLYHGKRELIKYIEHDLASVGEELKKIRCRLPFDIEDKYFVPINYSVETKLEWLSGLLDGDGCAVSHIEGNGCSIQLASINKKFLCDIVYMLQTLGCHSSIRPMHGERQTSIISGTYNCKASWRLLIASKAVEHLQAIGMSPRRLKLNGTSNRNATHYQRIVSVEDLDDVRALVRKPSCFSSNRSNRNFVTTNPRHESPMNSSVSKLCLVGSSFSLLLWVNARWYKLKSLIFVPRISSIEALVSSISVYRLQTYFLSLHVVRGQILLEVEERDDDIRRGFEEVSEGVVQDDLSSVLRVFQSLAGDVLVDLLGDLGAGDELLRCETQEGAEFVVDFLLTIEPVVRRPCLRLAPVGVVLLGFDLSTKLGEGLDLGAEGGDFLLEVELGGFRHLIPFLWVVSLSHEQGAQGDQ
jgi:ribonucleotide reductase alpha subunit